MAAGWWGWGQLEMKNCSRTVGLCQCPLASIYIHPTPPTPPFTHSHTHTPPSWHGRCSSLSHWLSVCWCGHLKAVSNVGRWPRDLEDTLINNRRATPLSESGTVETLWHCSAGGRRREGVRKKRRREKSGAVCRALTQLSPSLFLCLFIVALFVPGMEMRCMWHWQLELPWLQRVVTQKGLETSHLYILPSFSTTNMLSCTPSNTRVQLSLPLIQRQIFQRMLPLYVHTALSVRFCLVGHLDLDYTVHCTII